jgi:protein-S-isoprenylcysteine O-methyltransferase Ste14
VGDIPISPDAAERFHLRLTRTAFIQVSLNMSQGAGTSKPSILAVRLLISCILEMHSGTLRLTLFAVVSCWLVYISGKSLRVARSHGFYRFFAWEAIVALVLINSQAWFSDPFSILQILSWLFLIVSLFLLGQGMYLLRVAGKPSNQRQDVTLLSFEKTSTLVTSGFYRYIRHPLYGSLLFLAWGAFLKELTWYSVCLVVAATLCLVATAKADEAECVRYFGSSYEEYMSRTKMFVPFLF